MSKHANFQTKIKMRVGIYSLNTFLRTFHSILINDSKRVTTESLTI